MHFVAGFGALATGSFGRSLCRFRAAFGQALEPWGCAVNGPQHVLGWGCLIPVCPRQAEPESGRGCTIQALHMAHVKYKALLWKGMLDPGLTEAAAPDGVGIQ